ncbi:MAG: hypothetical protein JRN09_09335 [Nitrososphaerota archaeon]|nr:hypothetical protein [Nitrososphaerota archaeon]
MIPKCELCGQPAARKSPALCAECYYRYWYWQRNPRTTKASAVLGAVSGGATG